MLRVRRSRAHAPCDARGRAHLRGTDSLCSPRQIIEGALVPYSFESLSILLLPFRTGSGLTESHTEVCGVAVVHLAMRGS
jgi:hypothetical protein